MRFGIFAAVTAAATVFATPAAANGLRAEVRGGVAWCCGASSESIGAAVGYDADIGNGVFVGAEATADTDFDISSPVLGLNARLGAKMGETTRLFVSGGWAHDTAFNLDDAVIGSGVEMTFSGNTFVTLQYQRYIDLEINRATVGVGVRF